MLSNSSQAHISHAVRQKTRDCKITLNLTSYLQGAGSSTELGLLQSSEAIAGGEPQPNYGDCGGDKLGYPNLAEHLQQAMRVV